MFVISARQKCAQHRKQNVGAIRLIFHLSFFFLFYGVHKHNVELKKQTNWFIVSQRHGSAVALLHYLLQQHNIVRYKNMVVHNSKSGMTL